MNSSSALGRTERKTSKLRHIWKTFGRFLNLKHTQFQI